jgi:iron complex transport system permease protein
MIITKHRELIGLLCLAILSMVFSLSKGSVSIDYNALFKTLIGQGSPLLHDIIFNLRLPRTLSAFVTGALLALAGALMQVLLRNPLADPYILGISGGGAAVSLILIILGVSGYWLTGGAWLGSLTAVFLVFILAKRDHLFHSQRLLLTGVALASGFSALISFILVLSPDKELHSMLFWLLGDLSFAHMPIIESVILFISVIYSIKIAKELNILVRGEREAKALGINTHHLQLTLYFLSALLTASAVALAGCIGFVGLVIPHLFRQLGKQDHRILLPGSALLGGSLVTIADTFSRTVFAPQQLPVGIMMAFIGIPVFIILLHRNSSL